MGRTMAEELVDRNNNIFNKYHYDKLTMHELGVQYNISRERVRQIVNAYYEKNNLKRREEKNNSTSIKKKYYIIERPVLEFFAHYNMNKGVLAHKLGVTISRIEKSLQVHKVTWKRLKILVLGEKIYKLAEQGLKYEEIADKLKMTKGCAYIKLLRYCKLTGKKMIRRYNFYV